MATKINIKTTFEPAKTIQPIYTGGDVSLDATGKWLATCVEEDVTIVDVESGEPMVRIEGDGETITSLCLSPTASHLVVSSRSLSMRIYSLSISDSQRTAEVELVRTLKPHTSPVVTTCIDETGTLLATGGADSVVKIWDIQGGFTTHTFHGHSGVVSALCFLPRGSLSELTTSAANKRKGKRKSLSDGPPDSEDQSSDSVISLASADQDGSIRLWNLNSRKSIVTLDSHVSVVRRLAYSPKEKALLSVSRDKTMIIWDTQSWKQRKVIPALEVLEAGGFLLDGQYCYGGGENGNVRIWSTVTGQEVTTTQKAGNESDTIVSVVAGSNINSLMSIHQDQTIRIYSVQSLKDLPPHSIIEPLPVVRRISGNHDEIIDMACVGPDRSLLALATNTESIRLISISEQRTTKRKSKSNPTTSEQERFGSDLALLEGHEDIIICLDVDWSGHWLATGAKDNTARLWRLDPTSSTYTCFATFSGHTESLGAIALPRMQPSSSTQAIKEALNRAPEFLLTGSQDRTIKRWDPSKLACSPLLTTSYQVAKSVFTRKAHEKDINAIDVSPIASLFASASQDRTIKIYSLDNGEVAGILRGHKRGVWSVRFSPASAPPLSLSDGGTSGSRGLLVSGSGDRSVKVWSLSTYTCLLTFEGHSNSVLKVLWLTPLQPENDPDPETTPKTQPSQPIIASASSDTLIKLWSPYVPPTSDHLLTTLDNHSDRVWALTSPSSYPYQTPSKLSPTTVYPLISGAADARVTFWSDTTSQTLSVARATASARIEQDQALQNHIFAKNYREVITLALTLNHPGRLLRLFEDIAKLPASERDDTSIMGVSSVDDVIGSLGRDQLYLLLQRVRDWNTNARTSGIAQRVLHCVLKKYPASTFVEMAKDRRLGTKGSSGMKDLMRALEVYTERHYRRMEDLVDESWLLDYTLREMDEVAGTNIETGNGNLDVLVKENGVGDGDVIMI